MWSRLCRRRRCKNCSPIVVYSFELSETSQRLGDRSRPVGDLVRLALKGWDQTSASCDPTTSCPPPPPPGPGRSTPAPFQTQPPQPPYEDRAAPQTHRGTTPGSPRGCQHTDTLTRTWKGMGIVIHTHTHAHTLVKGPSVVLDQ